MYAAIGGHVDAVNVLLQQKANIHSIDTDGNTALHKADGNVEVIKTLLQNDANVDLRNDSGSSALMHMVSESGNEDAIKVLIEASASLDLQNDSGNSPLSFAVRFGILPAVNTLLLHKADVNTKNRNSDSPLTLAVRYEVLPVVQTLLLHKADVNTKNNQGYTPLFSAASRENIQAIRMLLDFKADVNSTDNEGCTAKDFVPSTRADEVLYELLLPPIQEYDQLFELFPRTASQMLQRYNGNDIIPIFDTNHKESIRNGREGIAHIKVTVSGSAQRTNADGIKVWVASEGKVNCTGARFHRAIAITIMIYERFKGGLVIVRVKGMSFTKANFSKGQNLQLEVTTFKVVMTMVERRFPNRVEVICWKGETHADKKNLKAEGHGIVGLKAGTSESVAKAIIEFMTLELEKRGSASIKTSDRDRTWIVLHEDGPYGLYLLLEYMLKAQPHDDRKWDRVGTFQLMEEFGIQVSGANVTHDLARAAACDDMFAIFDIRIGSDTICTSEEIVSNRKELDARIERLTMNGVLKPKYFTTRYWA